MGIFCIIGTESLLTSSFSYLLGCPEGNTQPKNERQHSFYMYWYVQKRQNGRQNSQKALHVPFPLQGPNFAGRGQVISGRLANRFGSQFGTNTKLLLVVIGPISMPNDYLNTVFHDAVSLCGRGRNNVHPQSPWEKL